jgi:hypothetical protein
LAVVVGVKNGAEKEIRLDQVWEHALKGQPSQFGMKEQKVVAAIMRRIGYKKTRIMRAGEQKWLWLAP